ncbi:MAG TPA: hypothetical protein VMM84_17950 [Pyrinomonadaceae bacterium]|nr:hypothetical protein [Pyrinomonadaceae bacterium]
MTSSKEQLTNQGSGNSIWKNERVWRFGIYAAVLIVVFLLGLVPMWMTARSRAHDRDKAQAALRISTLQNALADAAIDARHGEYEPARQAASDFFSNLRMEIDRGGESVFSSAQQNSLSSIFDGRDEIITLLARNDPASADRLVAIYNLYRQATAQTVSNSP